MESQPSNHDEETQPAIVKPPGIEANEQPALPEQGDIVREIIGPDQDGQINLQLPNVLHAIMLGAAVGASQYVRTRPNSVCSNVDEP